MNELNCVYKMYPYEIINENSKKYLYNIITSGIFELDDISVDILNGNYCKHSESEYREAIEFMNSKFIIQTDENDRILSEIFNRILSNKKTMHPNSLVLMITQDCNLRCKYCYGEDGVYSHKGMMSRDTAKKAIDYFIEQSNGETKSICFFGGEPLLNFNLIRELVTYSKELEIKNNISIGFSMTTNATLLNEEIERYIKENKIGLTVSIDGDEKVQNKNRYFANKVGCYKKVVKNTEMLRAANLLVARATVTTENIDILHSVEHLISLGFKKISWATAQNLMSEKDFMLYTKKQNKIIAKVEELIHVGDFKEAKKYGNVVKLLKRVDTDALRTKACGCGTNMIAVNIEGSIYPCHRFVGNESMRLGSIFDETCEKNDTFFEDVCVKSFDKCQTCFSRNLCTGGCVNENFESTGDLRIPPESRCEHIRELHRQIIKMYLRLTGDEKEKLFS